MISRRRLLAAAAAPFAAAKEGGLKIGVMDGVLRLSSKPEAVGIAKSLGLAGLQVTLGRHSDGERLLLDDAELQRRFVDESRKHSLPIDATYLDILHVNCLKNDTAAQKLVLHGIDATKALGAPILMTVFFGKCSITNHDELDYVAGLFKDLAREAERKHIIIGFENLLSAEDNARAMDRVASNAFKIYYDIGNSTNVGGFDVPKEIRWLGKSRVCQFHIKDKGYLGEGKVDVRGALEAIRDIGFQGFGNLETGSPSGSVEADARRNLTYLRDLAKGL